MAVITADAQGDDAVGRGRQLERRAFQITVGVLSVIPLASGLLAIIGGPGPIPGGPGRPSASLDSEYRFTNTFWVAVAPGVWWSIADLEKRAPVLRVTLGIVATGGFARLRLLSWRRAGRPHPVFVGATLLELVGMPAVLAWHARIVSARVGVSAAVRGPGRSDGGS